MIELMEGYTSRGDQVANVRGPFHAEDGSFITHHQIGTVVEDWSEDMVEVRYWVAYWDIEQNREAQRLVDVWMPREDVRLVWKIDGKLIP